jgi:shikimate dehydrogenase
MRKFGLIGYPLGHSFSKKYFTQKFSEENISDCSYENFPLESLDKFHDLLMENPDLCGLNVTIPYKTEILKFVDYKDIMIDEIGAVNVLKIGRDRGKIRISGYNSDITGIRDSILPFKTENVRNAMILGSGGSARAVAWTLDDMGINHSIISRSRKRGTIAYSDITREMIKGVQLIINTTPLGMYPGVETRPELNYNFLDESHILFDLVYNPEMTLFLRSGQERGCKIITGLKMLYSQADRSWEIWNDDRL